jgi:hypothetical protein
MSKIFRGRSFVKEILTVFSNFYPNLQFFKTSRTNIQQDLAIDERLRGLVGFARVVCQGVHVT